MIFRLEGKAIDSSSVSYRSMGFGHSTTLATKLFELCVDLTDLQPGFESKANSFIDDCVTDDKQQGYEDLPALAAIGYPDFITLVREHAAIAEALILDYLFIDIVDYLFGAGKDPRHIINNLHRVKIEHCTITLTGEVFTRSL